MSVRVLLIVCGHPYEDVKARFGEFPEQVATQLAHTHTKSSYTLEPYVVVDVWPGKPFPKPSDYDGVIVSGSPSMVDDKDPWIHGTKHFLERVLKAGVPYLGVCFGHQMLGSVCGATVGPNPSGRAQGSRRISVHAPLDPLFKHFPSPFWVQVSHRDVILRAPPSLKILGTTDHDAIHVVRSGKHAWGVQFHPEWTMDISAMYVQKRRAQLRAMPPLRPSTQSSDVLRYFIEYLQQNKNQGA
jgi:GMP synthase (glutamine-hydrolysing)